jgi:hypothetical protein
MRYFVGIGVSTVLIAFMFGFMQWMLICVKEWQAQQVVLPALAQTAVKAAFFIQAYWYLPVALFVLIPLAVAAVWPRKAVPR